MINSLFLELIFPGSKHNCFHWISYFQSSFIYIITHFIKLILFGPSTSLSHILSILPFKLPAFFFISSCHIYIVLHTEVVSLDHIYTVFSTEVVLHIYSVCHCWCSNTYLLSIQYLRKCYLSTQYSILEVVFHLRSRNKVHT